MSKVFEEYSSRLRDFKFVIYCQSLSSGRVVSYLDNYELITRETAEALAEDWMSKGYYIRPYEKDAQKKIIVKPIRIEIKEVV